MLLLRSHRRLAIPQSGVGCHIYNGLLRTDRKDGHATWDDLRTFCTLFGARTEVAFRIGNAQLSIIMTVLLVSLQLLISTYANLHPGMK